MFKRIIFNPNIRIEDDGKNTYLHVTLGNSIKSVENHLVASELLLTAIVSQQGFTTPEGSFLKIDPDYFGRNRDQQNPVPGPFESMEMNKTIRLKVW